MDATTLIASFYCERTVGMATGAAAGPFGEPLNTLTNLAFLAAALLAWRHHRDARMADRPIQALIIVCGVIGIGSFAFHAYPTRLTLLMDVVPIQIFILGYLGLVLRRYLGLAFGAAIAGTGLFLVVSFALVRWLGSGALGGSAGYLPALAALLVLGGLATRSAAPGSRKAGLALLQAGGIFALSLIFRTLDRPLCEAWPLGLHLVWHLLNAIVLWRLLVAAIDHRTVNQKVNAR